MSKSGEAGTSKWPMPVACSQARHSQTRFRLLVLQSFSILVLLEPWLAENRLLDPTTHLETTLPVTRLTADDLDPGAHELVQQV